MRLLPSKSNRQSRPVLSSLALALKPKHTTPGIGAPSDAVAANVRLPCRTPSIPTETPQIPSTEASKLLLHHLRAIVLGRIAHHFRFIDRGLAVSVRIRCAVRGTLSATFHEDMSLFV